MSELLRRRPWLIPLAFAVLLAGVGWHAYRTLEVRMRGELADTLLTIVDAEVAALGIWVDENRSVAELQASAPRTRELVAELLRAERTAEDPRAALLGSPAQGELRERLGAVAHYHGYVGYGVLDESGRFLAARSESNVGARPDFEVPILREVLAGSTRMTPPVSWPPGPDGREQTVMLLGAPVRDARDRPVALLGLAVDPEREFDRLLTIARPRETGETYAFDANGLMVSRSRFDDQLRAVGLLSAEATSSFRNIWVRDPGGDLTRGYRPPEHGAALPLTRAAAAAVGGERGVDVEGYRDYRGVPVVGAWAWLPALGIGIVTEVDVDEAFQGLFALRESFALVVGLLALGALAMVAVSWVAVRLRREADEARQIGRYRIERRIGKGGMGTVFLARHALLRRPTAIKILDGEKAGRHGLARFEREVQVSSSLTHPNTIEIYDFGYTPDGTFYYAMEYVDGATLRDCVTEDGALPEARLRYVMEQVCASIAEAHAAGLIHRDLKPANVMLCERGGIFDFVKVLDFGLVRPQQQAPETALTAVDALTGTPLYMPPEAVKSPQALDARGDVYQLGAIAYFLLAGRPVFQGSSSYEVLSQHVSAVPEPPSKRLGRSVSQELERIILWCLEKEPSARPHDAGVLGQALRDCPVEGSWSQAEARAWWERWRQRHPVVELERRPDESSIPSGYSVDLRERLTRDS